MTKTQKVFILLCRETFNEKEKTKLGNLLGEEINWSELFKYSLYHKTLTLVWKNLQDLKVRGIPKYFKYIAESARYTCNIRNKLYFKELTYILNHINSERVVISPVKGALLVPNIYADRGVRYIGDLDFVVRHSDASYVEKKMLELGYVYGTYDSKKKKILPMERTEVIKWKIGSTNMCPFLKINNENSEILPFYKIDFRHSFDNTLDGEPINEMLDLVNLDGELPSYSVFAHLACHFYSEATSDLAIQYYKDFNIIKLCDIREYVLKFMNEDSLNMTINFCKKYNLEKMLYFTLYYLKLIYDDGYEDVCLKKLIVENEHFLNEHVDEKNIYIWKKDYYKRIFSCHNLDELKNLDRGNKSF